MLTLPARSLGALVVMPDHADPTRSYVALARPRLSTGSPERPSLRLVAWTATLPPRAGEREVGGHLFLEVEVEPGPAELAAAGLAPAQAQPMPWIEAQAILHVQGAEPIASEVAVVAGGRAAFGTRLSPAQVGQLAPQLRGETVAPLQVTWVGRVRARLPAVEIVAAVDLTELRTRTATPTRDELGTHVTTHARVVITGAASPAVEASLRAWVLDALTEQVAAGKPALVHHAAAEVVPWPIQLSSTLDLDGLRGSEPITSLVLAPDELESPPPLRVQARGGFSAGVERVDVELRRPTGEPVRVSLGSETPAWVELGGDPLEGRHRVVSDGAAYPWSRWRALADLRELTIPVVRPAPRTIEVLLAGLDLRSRWAAVRVVLQAVDVDGSVRSHVVELHEGTRAGQWALPAGTEGAPVHARTTFVSAQGLVVERGPDPVEHDQVVVSDPFGHDRITVALVPAGAGWDDVALVMVDVRHEDGTWIHEQAVELRALTDFVRVDLPARAGGPRTVGWRVHASFSDGRFAQGPWQRTEAPLVVVTLPA
jgi:hypothetical protein